MIDSHGGHPGNERKTGWKCRTRVRTLDRIVLVLLGQFKPLMQLLRKRAVAHLFQDVGVPRLADLECFTVVGADDFVHAGGLLYVLVFWPIGQLLLANSTSTNCFSVCAYRFSIEPNQPIKYPAIKINTGGTANIIRLVTSVYDDAHFD